MTSYTRMPNESFVEYAKRQEAISKARNMRYKRAALASLDWDGIWREMDDIREECDGVRWYDDNEDSLVEALDGDEEEAYEFRMAFADLCAKIEEFDRVVNGDGWEDIGDYFDDCIVSLIGNRYNCIGYDSYEEDYYALSRYEAGLAQTESGKRVTRWTKQEMLAKIGQCLGVLIAFLDIRQRYDYLSGAMSILRGQNHAIIDAVKQIEAAYEAYIEDPWRNETALDKIVEALPERLWIE